MGHEANLDVIGKLTRLSLRFFFASGTTSVEISGPLQLHKKMTVPQGKNLGKMYWFNSDIDAN